MRLQPNTSAGDPVSSGARGRPEKRTDHLDRLVVVDVVQLVDPRCIVNGRHAGYHDEGEYKVKGGSDLRSHALCRDFCYRTDNDRTARERPRISVPKVI
jgi:hypothetical protein